MSGLCRNGTAVSFFNLPERGRAHASAVTSKKCPLYLRKRTCISTMDQHNYAVCFLPTKRRIRVNKTESTIDVTIGK